VANGINDFGQVIGWSHTAAGTQHAFLWPVSGRMQDLGTLSGSTTSIASGINNATQVVGTSGGHAFLWSVSRGMIDLNTLLPPGSGWVLTNASGINANGQIVGTGTINGQTHGFLLTLASH
jgi:probable HAF family extracellular repeat protein